MLRLNPEIAEALTTPGTTRLAPKGANPCAAPVPDRPPTNKLSKIETGAACPTPETPDIATVLAEPADTAPGVAALETPFRVTVADGDHAVRTPTPKTPLAAGVAPTRAATEPAEASDEAALAGVDEVADVVVAPRGMDARGAPPSVEPPVVVNVVVGIDTHMAGVTAARALDPDIPVTAYDLPEPKNTVPAVPDADTPEIETLRERVDWPIETALLTPTTAVASKAVSDAREDAALVPVDGAEFLETNPPTTVVALAPAGFVFSVALKTAIEDGLETPEMDAATPERGNPCAEPVPDSVPREKFS